jgi:hypothetical protein
MDDFERTTYISKCKYGYVAGTNANMRFTNNINDASRFILRSSALKELSQWIESLYGDKGFTNCNPQLQCETLSLTTEEVDPESWYQYTPVTWDLQLGAGSADQTP